jgi:hypothetical protein
MPGGLQKKKRDGSKAPKAKAPPSKKKRGPMPMPMKGY